MGMHLHIKGGPSLEPDRNMKHAGVGEVADGDQPPDPPVLWL